MTDDAPARRYDSSRRQARAAEGRRRIIETAHDLFIADGYAATTISAVAEAADVSVPTVYAGFASKAELLTKAIDVALAGDDDPIAVADRPIALWVDEAEAAAELLSRYAVMMGELAERAAPIFRVLDEAAGGDSELAQLRDSLDAQRLVASMRIAKAVQRRGGLPKGRSLATARDLVWLCNSTHNYVLLVLQRGWSKKRYVEWARKTLVDALLGA